MSTMTELTPEQRALAEAMSDVSERAYCGGWMDGTEYEVWRLLHDGGGWGWAGAPPKPDWPECMCTPTGECGRCREKRQLEATP